MKLIKEWRTPFISNEASKSDSSEYMDFDKYLFLIMEEFVETRKRNLNNLKAIFNEKYETDKGYFSCEDFKSIINQTMDFSYEINNYSFPKSVVFFRSFIYALTAHKNSLDITLRSFIAAIHRYGVDSPFPSIISTPKQIEQIQEKATDRNKLNVRKSSTKINVGASNRLLKGQNSIRKISGEELPSTQFKKPS